MAYTIIISCPTITITPTMTALPNGTAGILYSETISASGGTAPYTFSVASGSLPPGLFLNATTGEISGTPITMGIYSFEIRVKDADCCLAFMTYTLIINCPIITITPTTLPNGTVGIPYSQEISASGGTPPYTFKVTMGSLPPGLILTTNSLSTALIVGIPTVPGTFTFEVSAIDRDGCDPAQAFSITIDCPVTTFGPLAPTTGTVGTPYSSGTSLTITGGASAYNFEISRGSLPPGLVLSGSGTDVGLISGTPTREGTYAFTITARPTNSTCHASCVLTLEGSITICRTIILGSQNLPVGTLHKRYKATIPGACGGVDSFIYTVTSGQLPPGLFLNCSTGVITGTPTSLGTFTFTITATDRDNCSGEQTYTIVIQKQHKHKKCKLDKLTPGKRSSRSS